MSLNVLYITDAINKLRAELFYLAQNPSVQDINDFFKKKKTKIYLKPSQEPEAEQQALAKVCKALLALAAQDFSGFRSNSKKVFRAEKALKSLNHEALCKEIYSIYSSYQLTYYKQIEKEKIKQRKQILEDIGVDYYEKTPVRRDIDELEDQAWIPAGQLARENQQSSSCISQQNRQPQLQSRKQVDRDQLNHSSSSPFSIQPNTVIPKATKPAQNSKPLPLTPYIQIPPSINISANSFLFTTSTLIFNSSSLSILNSPAYKKQVNHFSTNNRKTAIAK